MKKGIFILFSLILLLSLVGCMKRDAEDVNQQKEQKTEIKQDYLQLKERDYNLRELKDFNDSFRPLVNTYTGSEPTKEEDYFMQSLFFSSKEIASPKSPSYVGKLNIPDMVKVKYKMSWNVTDYKNITVKERDDYLKVCLNDMKTYASGLTKDFYKNKKSINKMNEHIRSIISNYSYDKMTVTIKIVDYELLK